MREDINLNPNRPTAAHVVAGQLAAEAAYKDVKLALNKHGIEVIVLKGPHLGAVYYDDASQREYTDLDLLIRPGRFDEAASVLVESGYRPLEGPVGRYVQGFESPQGWPVELHRAFEAYGLFRVDYEGLFSRAEPFVFGQVSALGLAREDLLVHLVIHAAKSLYREIGYKHVLDVSCLVRHSIQWDLFVVRAGEARCCTASCFLLSAASRCCSADVPRDVLRQLQPSWLRRVWLRLWLRQDEYPLFHRERLPVWFGRLVVMPAIVDRMRDGVMSGLRFALTRARDIMR